MLGPRGLFPRVTSLWATAFVLLGQWTPLGVGLRTTPGSPCTDTCTQRSTNTTGADIVCLDRQFSDTSAGSNFQQCVECQLRSSFTDSATGQSDVEWGLCMYLPAKGDDFNSHPCLHRQSALCLLDLCLRISRVGSQPVDPLHGVLSATRFRAGV